MIHWQNAEHVFKKKSNPAAAAKQHDVAQEKIVEHNNVMTVKDSSVEDH